MTPVRRPWVMGSVHWTPALTRRAVIWLSLLVKKGLLKLSEVHSNHPDVLIHLETLIEGLWRETSPALGLESHLSILLSIGFVIKIILNFP